MREAIVLILFISQLLYSQTGIVRGLVKNQSTGEPVIGATVVIEGTSFGTTTDRLGWFEIKGVPPGRYNLVVSALDFEVKRVEVYVLSEEISYVNVEIRAGSAGKSFSIKRKVEGYLGASRGALFGFEYKRITKHITNIEFGILVSKVVALLGSWMIVGENMEEIVGVETKIFASDVSESTAFFVVSGLHYHYLKKLLPNFGVGVSTPIKNFPLIVSLEARAFFDISEIVPFEGVIMIGLGIRF